MMTPGARMLLLTTEDTFSGACTSFMWRCRTYNRRELARICEEVGLKWKKELWYTRVHRVLHAGGICAELVKSRSPGLLAGGIFLDRCICVRAWIQRGSIRPGRKVVWPMPAWSGRRFAFLISKIVFPIDFSVNQCMNCFRKTP